MKPYSSHALLAMFAVLIVLPLSAFAQLRPEQRTLDFQNLVALYAKRYAPYDWKRRAVGFDLFDIKPWFDRIQNAKDDLEFFEIEAEYVGKLQDTHSGFQMTSSFRATLGITVDIYDGKVLIDSINRSLLPAPAYPFQIGDEVVSVDSVSAEDWIKRVSVWRQYGNPTSTRRLAAAQVTVRSQAIFPRAIEIGDSATVEIRRAGGAIESYTIRWNKSGVPVTNVGPVPFPSPMLNLDQAAETPDYLAALDELHNYQLPANDLIRAYVNGVGSPVPIFRGGFPTNFVQRLGRTATDFHYSGTYTASGLTIGYLRIPNFAPPNTSAIVSELRTEIDYLQKNTDGLVVDVMRNPGGGCYMLDVAAALIPYPFYFFGEEIRATQDRLNSFQALFESAQAARADQTVIDAYQSYVNQMKAALSANRGMTAPIPACRQFGQTSATTMNNNAPGPVVYTKPVIVLIDEFSISAADIFPSMIQDNKRALLVGARSSGGGGSVSGWPTGFYSESFSTNTNTLVVRKDPIVTPEYPTAPYVENIGARPDIPIAYMTRDNLVNGGRTFVDQFTQVLVKQIKDTLGEAPFLLSDRGGVSWSTANASEQPVVGYGRIRTNSGSISPAGLAILGVHQGNVLISEAGVAASPLIQSGRIYAEINGPVNTGLAIANPNDQPATVSFYFTGPTGNFGNGSITIAANGQVAAFLDQSPFNGGSSVNGTFTFSSPVPIAVVALRGLTNERGEFLMTTLPVADLAVTPTAGATPVFPHFAYGGGWTTQVALVNPTDTAMTGAILFKDPSGTTIDSVNYSIGPRMSGGLGFAARGPQSVQTGSIIVLPDAQGPPPVGLAIFSYSQNGITVTETGVPAMNAASAYRLYAEASGNFNGGVAGSVETGLAVVNRSSAAVTVTVELRRLDGSSIGLTGSIVVPAGGQTAKFLNQIVGLASQQLPFQGTLRISAPSEISVIGIRGRYNERNEFLITTLPPVNEASAPAPSDLFFPHFADGGGYTTQFVLFNGSPGQQSSGTLRLFSQSGKTLNLTLR